MKKRTLFSVSVFSVALLMGASQAQAAATDCGSVDTSGCHPCNSASNIPVGNDFCHMSDAGFGADCVCDFTDGWASGDPAYPGTVNCSGVAGPNPTDEFLNDVLFELADAAGGTIDIEGLPIGWVAAQAGLEADEVNRAVFGDPSRASLEDLLRVAFAVGLDPRVALATTAEPEPMNTRR